MIIINDRHNKFENEKIIAKDLRIAVLGLKCEFCGARDRRIVGHHTRGRDFDGCNDWHLIQLRCEYCESKLHKAHPSGNTIESRKIQKAHNRSITHHLEKQKQAKKIVVCLDHELHVMWG